MLNDETILSGSKDETIEICKIDSGECLKTLNFNECVRCVETFNDDKMLIIGTEIDDDDYESEGNDVIIFDLNKNEELKRIKSAHSGCVSNLVLLSNGNLLNSSGDSIIKLWSLLE
jgi:WD40 repeat protein